MIRLTIAGLARLRKSKVFWIGVAAMFGLTLYVVLNQYRVNLGYDDVKMSVNDVMFAYTMFIGIAAAVFSSLFLGTEYSDGTMRNKLVVGHSRAAIYFSNLATTIIAALLMCASSLAVVFGVGLPLAKPLDLDGDVWPMIVMFLGSFLMVCAVCAILTATSMLVTNKAIAAIVSLFAMLGSLGLGFAVQVSLEAPEYYSSYELVTINEDGTAELEPVMTKNPKYLTGQKRIAYEHFYDLIPGGQAFQYVQMHTRHPYRMMAYSAAIFTVFTLFGMAVFRRKNIK